MSVSNVNADEVSLHTGDVPVAGLIERIAEWAAAQAAAGTKAPFVYDVAEADMAELVKTLAAMHKGKMAGYYTDEQVRRVLAGKANGSKLQLAMSAGTVTLRHV